MLDVEFRGAQLETQQSLCLHWPSTQEYRSVKFLHPILEKTVKKGIGLVKPLNSYGLGFLDQRKSLKKFIEKRRKTTPSLSNILDWLQQERTVNYDPMPMLDLPLFVRFMLSIEEAWNLRQTLLLDNHDFDYHSLDFVLCYLKERLKSQSDLTVILLSYPTGLHPCFHDSSCIFGL